MKKPIAFLISSVLFSSSAGGTEPKPLKVKQKSAIRRLIASKSKTQDWIQAYVVTKQLPDPLVQCAGFKKLMEDKSFPLKDFAHMRASLICKELEEPWTPENDWLRPRWSLLKTEALREQAPKSLELAKSLHDNLKYTSLNESRVRLIEEALKIAKANKTPEAKELIKEWTQSLENTAPRFKKSFTKEEFISVAKDFQRARDFKKARKLYLVVLNKKGFTEQDRIAAWNGLVRIEKLERDKTGHIAMLKKYVAYLKTNLKTSRDIKRYLDAEADLVRAIWTIGQTRSALKILKQRLKNKFKGHSFALQNWLVGRIYEELKQPDKTVTYLNAASNEPISDLEFRDTVRWDLAWTLFKINRHTEAIQHFQKITELTENEFHKARALYWQSQSFKELRQVELNTKALQDLVALDPLGYYGMIAHRELGIPIKMPGIEKVGKKDSDETFFGKRATNKVYHPEWVDWMLEMGEQKVISEYLNSVVDIYKKETDQDDEVWLSILKSYAKGGDYLKLFEKLYLIDPKVREQILTDHPELLFPTPYMNEVQEGGKRFGVEPSLIFSITRQESAFNPEARSPADAMGLMQLLPSVAKKMGKEIGVPVKDYRDLFEPEKNIQLASYLLAKQMKRHKNEFIAYVASYNASDQAIRNWKKTRPSKNPMQFIEDIPYEETRSYVRLIIRNYTFYKLILSGEKEIRFPEEVF